MIDFGSSPDGDFPAFQPVKPISPSTPPEEQPPYLSILNTEQREAALCTEGPLMVLAGAGSGKTRMLTARISYLIDHLRVSPAHVLAVTFTNKAAGEMQERVSHSLAQVSSGGFARPEIGTFHAVCVRILRRELDRLPFTKAFTIYDDSDQLSLIKTVMKKLNINDKTYNPQAFQASINRAKCDALGPHELDISQHSAFQRTLGQVYVAYEKELVTSNALDFGEIICMTYRLLRDNDDIRRKYQNRYRYIHVDEYQDTNRAQYLLLSMLAGPENGGHRNICIVGDEDQSIYKWRGADIRNILDFEKDFGGATVVKLEQNYRSTQTIIGAAGHLIRNNSQRKDKNLWTENEAGPPILCIQVPDERAEAELVVGEIKRLAAEEGYSLDDFAVFYRTHAQSRQFEDLLRREKIAYQIVGGLRFYERKEIKDVMAYFRVLLNPSDSVSLKRIINVPARGIGKTTIEKLEAAVTGEPGRATLWEILKNIEIVDLPGKTEKKLQDFVATVEDLGRQRTDLLLSEVYHRLLDKTAYVPLLKQEGTVEALARIENLEELDNLIQEFEEEVKESGGLAEEGGKLALLPLFLERTSLDFGDEKGVEVSSVKMMSLHSSKGLEFPVVFMVGLEEGLFPSSRAEAADDESELEEERRLCYVGMTRARRRLTLLNSVCRRIWGTTHYQEPARFLSEIPDEFVKRLDFSMGRFRPTGYS